MHVIGVALATYFFNYSTEQNETIVAVLPTTAWFEPERPIAIEMNVVLQGMQLKAMLIKLWSPDIAGSASVGQQLSNRHFGCEFLVRVVRQIFSQRIAKCHFSCLHLLHE